MAIEVADWLDIQANSSVTVLDTDLTGSEQAMDILAVGGRPEDSVTVETIANFVDIRGSQEVTQELVTRATEDFNAPITSGPVATTRFRWRVVNDSGTAFTAGGNDPYQTFIRYAIRPLTIVEKLRRGLPLSGPTEENLATTVLPGQVMSLTERNTLDIPPEVDPAFQPNLDGKKVIETETFTISGDISATGTDEGLTVLDERVRRSPETGLPRDIIYLTNFGGNWAEFEDDDDLQLRIIRNETDEVARIKTFGLPGIGTGTGVTSAVQAGTSQPPYLSQAHVPATSRLTVKVFANGAAANGIEVRAEIARVERDLVEKAIYNLRNEVRTDDGLAERRLDVFDQIRRLVRAGLPITVDVQREIDEVEAAAPA